MSRPRRVLLFMPGDDLRKITKGAASGVDSVIMDLEDAVALGRKEPARAVVVEALRTLDFGTTERLVRINGLTTGLAEDDVAATVALSVSRSSNGKTSSPAKSRSDGTNFPPGRTAL